MENVLIVFLSMTTANRIKSELERRYGIKSKVMQTPKTIPVKSCSYCIRLAAGDLQKTWNMIKNLDVYTKGVYRESDNSKMI